MRLTRVPCPRRGRAAPRIVAGSEKSSPRRPGFRGAVLHHDIRGGAATALPVRSHLSAPLCPGVDKNAHLRSALLTRRLVQTKMSAPRLHNLIFPLSYISIPTSAVV